MNQDAVAQPNSKAERCREVKSHVASSVSKRQKTRKKSVENPVFDTKELVAQIHPNEITDAMPIAVEGEITDAIPITVEGEVRGSKRKDRSKKGTDASQKWNDEEEVCIAMALLESCPLGGKVNTAAYYQRAKQELGSEVSNERLYYKMRRMKKRFRDIRNKLKEQNIEEDNFTFRTSHEPALFLIWKQIWGQNNDFLQTECRKLYLGDSVAENPNSNEVEIRNTDSEEIDPGNTNSKEVEAGNPAPMEVVLRNPQRRVIDAEKGSPRRIGNERSNSRIVEAGNSDSRINEAEKISSDEFVNPNSKKIEDINSKVGNAGTGTTACGDRRKVQLRYKQQEEDEEKNGAAESEISQGPQFKETETEYVSKRGRNRLLQCESRDWDSKMQCMIRNVESRLEEVMESSASRAIHAANFQTLGGFEVELGMGTCGYSSVTRRTNELINFSEQFYGVDAAEAQELQKKWNEINIQKTKIFSAHVELLNDQCKLFLKTVEQQGPQECSYQEILLEKQNQNGLRKCKNKSLENSLQSFMKNTQSKLEAASCINAAFTGSFCPSGGFGSVEMGSCAVLNLSRRMQELMDDVNSVEEFPCRDAMESSELQQKWRKIKIQKLKMFSQNLELLKDECKLLLKSLDISNGCHRP